MQYEHVGYIVEFEIGALAVFLVIMVRYLGARRFPNQKNRLYSLILWATVAYMALDVFSSAVIDSALSVPAWITHDVNVAFYAISILMLMLMMLYALSLMEHLNGKTLRRYALLFLPGILVLLALSGNHFTHWFFYVDPVRGYVRGKLFSCIYAACVVYLIFSLAIAFRGRHKLRKIEYQTILHMLLAVMVSAFIQYLYPALLVTGAAIAMAVVLMYFTLQNPDTMVDATTGAFTYDAMLAFLGDRAQDRDRVQFVAVKIRNMSRINDLLGIESGSLLLGQITRFLRECAQDSWVFRMRGNCFVAVTRKKADYQALSARVDERLGQPWIVKQTEVLLQASVCCVETEALLADPISPAAAVDYLEIAFLQSEKLSGRIVKITAGTEMLEKVKRIRAVESALRDALDSGEGLELYFQPLWSVKRRRFVRAEVLLRFHHPTMGLIPPSEFITIAENNGFVMAIDELVVRKTCAFLQEANNFQGLGLEALEVNLSALEFMRRRLPEMLRGIMEHYRTDPRFLCFEITETAATESFDLLRECMLEIERFGCEFALDDFGTGYANISQVIQLPFSVVKLDKSLLYGPSVVLEDMARMFARMNRETVIEGVETQYQADLVKAFDVEYIQGFYYAAPMNQADFVQFLRRNAGRGPAAETKRSENDA